MLAIHKIICTRALKSREKNVTRLILSYKMFTVYKCVSSDKTPELSRTILFRRNDKKKIREKKKPGKMCD